MLTWPQGTGIIAQIKLRLVLDDSRSRGGDCEHACDSVSSSSSLEVGRVQCFSISREPCLINYILRQKIERPCALSDEGDGRPKPIHPVLATDHFN